MYEEFYKHAENIVSDFRKLDPNLPIRIISHLDADGLTAASILIKSLIRENRKFSLSIIKQISRLRLKEFSKEDYGIYFFTDLGSNNLSDIEELFNGKEVFILDHHIPEKKETKLNFLNPHLFDIDGTSEVSGAGVTYIFSKTLNESNKDLSYLAIVGAFGDIQYNDKEESFSGINKEILEDAIAMKKIKIEKGLKIFGLQSRALHKLLEYSTDPFIPGITGDSKAAIHFLNELRIPVKDNENNFRRTCDLSEEEIKRLVTGIILRRMGSEEEPENILGDIYLVNGENEKSLTRNAKEFSTLLNACGKLNKSSIGIGICIKDQETEMQIEDVLLQYKREIIGSLNWFYSNRKTNSVKEYGDLVIINAENNLRDTLLGTMTSLISKSNLYNDGTIIFGMGYTPDNEIKVSIRSVNSDANLKQMLEKIGAEMELQLGGHKSAAGCLIPLEKEKEFIELIEKNFVKNQSNT